MGVLADLSRVFDGDGEDEDASDLAAVVQAVVVAEEAADSAPAPDFGAGALCVRLGIPLQPFGVQLSQVLPQEPTRLLVGGDVFVVEAAVCP